MVGSLSFLASATRPDLATAVGVVSRFLDKPTKTHCNMVKQIYYFLRATSGNGLVFKADKSNDMTLTGYCDASWGNKTTHQSLTMFSNCTTAQFHGQARNNQ